jgi:uncharacterized repeat protein (TIGR01451 family)
MINCLLRKYKSSTHQHIIINPVLSHIKWIGLAFVFMLILLHSSVAEGTKQASPNSSTISALVSAPDLANGSFFNAPEDNRLFFSIKNSGTESLYFGFDWRTFSTSTANNVYYRIMNPDGSVALGPTLWSSAGPGRITTYAQAIAGPNIAGSLSAGYTPLVFNPTMNGEYWIEYWLGTSSTNSTPITTSAGRIDSPLFDLTVANRTSPYAVQSGRLFTYKWGLLAVASDYSVQASADAAPDFYAYTADKLVIRLQFATGFQPISYAVGVNSYGVNDSGNPVVDRRSVNSADNPSLPGGYMVFLNPPDVSIYPVATDPGQPTFRSPIFEGCVPPYGVRFTLPADGDARILFDLNGVAGYQAGTADRILEGFNLTAGPNTIPWDGKNGLGVSIANNVSLNIKLTYLRGRFNFPLYDAEINKNGFTVTTISPAGLPTPKLYWDDSALTNVGTSCTSSTPNNNTTGAGLDNSLIGTTAPAHAWNGNGNTAQTIPAPAVSGNDTDNLQCNDFGNVRTINTFGWGQEKEVSATGVLGCPDLTISKTVNNATPNKGGTVTFTITAQNLGPSAAPSTVVTDVLPSGFTLVSAVPSVGTFTAPNWNVGSLAVGATPTLVITATVNCSGLYTNIASIASSQADINPNNNNAFAVVTPRSTGTINLTNICPATTVNLTTQAPCNTPSGATLTWHTSATATSVNKVPNPASVGAGTYYAAFEDAANNCYSPTTSYTVTIQSCNADLVMAKSVNNSTPNVGSNVTFTLSVTNNGPAAATGVSVNDLLPNGYTFVSDNGGGTYNSGTGVWTIGNLANAASASLQITATVKATGSYANTAIVTGNQPDPNTNNNTATSTPIPVPVADLSITKTDGRATYTPGASVSYTVVVGNAGPSNVIGATVADAAPAGTSISSWSAVFAGGATGTSSGSGNISQTVSVPSGGSVTYTVVVAVPSGLTGSLTNTATVTAPVGVTDLSPANNSATDTDTQNSVADLSITKTDGSVTYTPGTSVSYTVVVGNAGPSNVVGATVADAAPAGTSISSWSAVFAGGATGTSSGSGNISQTVSVPSGGSVTYTVVVAVPSGLTGSLTNTATVTAPAGVTDLSPANNSATDTDTQNSVADLSIVKTVAIQRPEIGANATFTLLVTNSGPSAATSVVVADLLPSGYSYQSSIGSGSYNSGTGVWTIGNLANGGTATLAITATMNVAGSYSNVASVSGNGTDPNTANNTSTAGVQAQTLLPKVYLQGALFGIAYSGTNGVDSLMRDDLRVKNLIPLSSPYSGLNPTVVASTIPAGVLNATGRDAIVDWVFVELRNATNPLVIVSSRSALLQRDGDIVSLDGVSPIPVLSPVGSTYYVAVRHRNHLAIMTEGAVTMTAAGTTIDFRKASTPTYRKANLSIHQSQVSVLQGKAMWAGNALRDNAVIYQGTGNDVNPIYQQVIGAPGNPNGMPFRVQKGYEDGDINMNGEMIFQGTRNDTEYIYHNIFRNHPGNTTKANNFIIQQQLPE